MTRVATQMTLRKQQILRLLVLGDLLAVLLALFAAYFLRLRIYEDYSNLRLFLGKALILYGPLALLYLCTFYVFDVYSVELHSFRVKCGVRLLEAVIVATLVATSLLFFVPEYIIGRTPLFLFATMLLVFSSLFHLTASGIKLEPQQALVVLKDENEPYFQELVEELRGVVRFKFKYVQQGDRFLDAQGESIDVKELITRAASDVVDIVVFSSPITFDLDDFREFLVLRCPDKQILEFSQLYAKAVGKIPVHKIRDFIGYSFASTSFLQARVYLQFKRFTDVALSVFFLILFSPLLLACAVMIRLDSPGPVFFVQERLGYKRKSIRIVKFRTMVRDAEKLTGPIREGENDPRITRVGRILRSLKLDELPQLANILRGDLSFIGPRPVRKVFEDACEKEIPLYFLRHMIKPGLTGWAQVSNKLRDQRDERWELERFQYDLYYMNNCSLGLDMYIIVKTAKLVFSKIVM